MNKHRISSPMLAVAIVSEPNVLLKIKIYLRQIWLRRFDAMGNYVEEEKEQTATYVDRSNKPRSRGGIG